MCMYVYIYTCIWTHQVHWFRIYSSKTLEMFGPFQHGFVAASANTCYFWGTNSSGGQGAFCGKFHSGNHCLVSSNWLGFPVDFPFSIDAWLVILFSFCNHCFYTEILHRILETGLKCHGYISSTLRTPNNPWRPGVMIPAVPMYTRSLSRHWGCIEIGWQTKWGFLSSTGFGFFPIPLDFGEIHIQWWDFADTLISLCKFYPQFSGKRTEKTRWGMVSRTHSW